VVSNADAVPYGGADGWEHRLAAHLVSPVRWRSSMETLAGLDVDTFFEVGPGNVLAALARRTVPAIAVRGISVPTDALLEVA
jgi:[acyl-carrier-protein] S-malonyltransferase